MYIHISRIPWEQSFHSVYYSHGNSMESVEQLWKKIEKEVTSNVLCISLK